MFKATTTAAALLVLALPALASASLRGLQAAATPAAERVCNATELDARLEALKATPECATTWPAFSDGMDAPAWAQLSLDDKTKALDTFCKGACGPAFDTAVAGWRSWCDSDRASFEPIPADDGKPPAFSFEGFVAEFGCAKAASGNYCARLVVDNLQAAATDTTAKCGYYASCCAGELSRVVRLADAEDRAAKREAQCPGARAALTQKCAA